MLLERFKGLNTYRPMNNGHLLGYFKSVPSDLFAMILSFFG